MTYEAVLVPGMTVVPRTLLFQETVTMPGKEMSAWKGPVFSISPTMTMSIEVAVGLVMSCTRDALVMSQCGETIWSEVMKGEDVCWWRRKEGREEEAEEKGDDTDIC
jgi:hypothetical protein